MQYDIPFSIKYVNCNKSCWLYSGFCFCLCVLSGNAETWVLDLTSCPYFSTLAASRLTRTPLKLLSTGWQRFPDARSNGHVSLTVTYWTATLDYTEPSLLMFRSLGFHDTTVSLFSSHLLNHFFSTCPLNTDIFRAQNLTFFSSVCLHADFIAFLDEFMIPKFTAPALVSLLYSSLPLSQMPVYLHLNVLQTSEIPRTWN